MNETQLTSPELHGDWMHQLVVRDGHLMREKFHEGQLIPRFHRVRVQEHPDYRGISVYDLFDATNYMRAGSEPVSLRQARERADRFPKHVRFLLSLCKEEMTAVVTSQFGFDSSRAIQVPLERPIFSTEKIDMYDFGHTFSYPDLTKQHISRYAAIIGMRPNDSATPYARNNFFREMVLRLPEEQ